MSKPDTVRRTLTFAASIGECWFALLPDGNLFLAPCAEFTEADAQAQYELDWKAKIQ